MFDNDIVGRLSQEAGDDLHHGHGPVATSKAAKAKRDVGLIDYGVEVFRDARSELDVLRVFHDIRLHGSIKAGQMLERRLTVRVSQASAVERLVALFWVSLLCVPEADQLERHLSSP
jgi:hypothetical protein